MLLINVNKQANQQELIKYIKKILPKAPISFIHKLFRKKDIKVNGKSKRPEFIISEGDEIKVFITENQAEEFGYINKPIDTYTNKKSFECEILYEDENVLFVNKPIGLLSQKANKTDISLNDKIINYIGKASGFSPSIVNRLDRNTSGIVAVGKTYVGLKELSRIFRDKLVKKFYFTIVEGKIEKNLYLTDYLSRANNVSKIEGKNAKESKLVKTNVIPLHHIDNFTICKIELLTGKTHQIRAHLSSIEHPIVGDIKYGSGIRLSSHILHCAEMEFQDNDTLGFNNFIVKSSPSTNKLFKKFLGDYSWLHGELEG